MKAPAATGLVLLLTALTTNGQTSPAPNGPADSGAPYTIVERGPNSRRWQKVEWETTPSGTRYPHVHSYVELASGLHAYRNNAWIDADSSFEITPDGFAIVRNCQHQVIVSPTLGNTNGVIDFLSADGRRFRSGILGLVLFDPASGKSLQIAAVKTSGLSGSQTAPNEITFPDAFEGLKASVRIRNEIGRFHQEALLAEKLTDDQITRFGFSPDSVRLEVWSEFLEAPTPSVETVAVKDAATGAIPRTDDFLDFGDSKMARGSAFIEGQPDNAVVVTKRWFLDPDSKRTFLIEAADYSDLRPLLQALPEAKFADYKPRSNKGVLASAGPSSPGRAAAPPLRSSTAPVKAKSKDGAPRIAWVDPAKIHAAAPPLVWDYVQLTGTVTNQVFASDQTYYISSALTLTGTNVWEPCTVLKFASNASITVVSPFKLDFRGKAYGPVVFTSKDDTCVGENTGGNGNPQGYYANPALSLSGIAGQSMDYVRFLYARQALNAANSTLTIRNAQLANCQSAFGLSSSTLSVQNGLFANVKTNFVSSGSATCRVDNATFSAYIPECWERLKALGRLSHSWQDFYAHGIHTSRGFVDPMSGSPSNPGDFWPSSYNSWHGWDEGEHPNREEPVAVSSQRYNQAEAYTALRFRSMLENWLASCKCLCQ